MFTDNEKKVYNVLDKLEIKYTRYEHKPIFTIAEANKLNINISGQHCKNLFLRNRKGNEHYLVILDDSKKANLKELAAQIGSKSLSFASEKRLYKFLGLKPGSVSPFGLINDNKKDVVVLLDKDLIYSNSICFHPNVNTATIKISVEDFKKYLKWCKNEIIYVNT